MTEQKDNRPVATQNTPAGVDPKTREQLLDLARRAEDMHGVLLVNQVAALACGHVDRPWAGFAALVDALMVLDSLLSHGVDPETVSNHTDRDAAVREWEGRVEDAVRMVLGVPALTLVPSTSDGAR